MFGMGFMEIFLVLIVAVIALGPEKLPSAAVDIVKFFKKFKSSIDEAKSTLDNELNISEMKKEAEQFKSSVSDIKNIASLELDDLTSIEEDLEPTENKKKKKTLKQDTPTQQVESKEKKVKKETISFDKEVK
ncbi:MAG: twin-arginine translocase subunit TatB [Arcobacter sp.]|nr:MAG: twin-arginine translocase subunit TatB [Arcobacter sp.]